MSGTNTFALPETVTIVVAPREKHSTLCESLDSLFRTIPRDVQVIACLPRLPPAVRDAAKRIMDERGSCDLHELEEDVIPHRARAFGAALVSTPWLVFCDNDLAYEPGWLEALGDRIAEDKDDVLAPLIFIGPPAARTIHHAGGLLHTEVTSSGKLRVSEKHRCMDRPIDDPEVQRTITSDEYRVCDVAEFHCLALRSDLLRHRIRLPEVLITREQQDLALQCRNQGLRTGFVPQSRVTYMARTKFTSDDLRYHAARWSEQRALKSLDHMETTWDMDFDRKRVVHDWIEQHRRRPFRLFPRLQRWIPRRLEGLYLKARHGYDV